MKPAGQPRFIAVFETPQAAEDRLFFKSAAFERAIREIRTVRAVRVGRRVTRGAGYEQLAPDTAPIASSSTSTISTGCRRTSGIPRTKAFGTRFGSRSVSALVYDFEVGGMEVLEKLA